LNKPLILVTGSDGQLGSEINRASEFFYDFQFQFIDKKDVDLSDEEAFKNYADSYDIKYLINCAAYTAVDLAEKEIELANAVNDFVPGMLARYCKDKGIRMIHISTDYVFEGNGNRPISEDEFTSPVSVYGKTKLGGEKRVFETLPNAYVIRTAWVYSVFGKNFVKTMISLGRQRDSLNVVYDQIGSPTNAADLAEAILKIIQSIEVGIDKPGIYHYSNEGVISWFDFAYEIMRQAKLHCKVFPILTHEYPTAAKRPAFSVLNKTKIKQTFGIQIPFWTESLEKTIKELTV
jgi:dTDP-4-dehydrorhamnose reductase